MMIILLLTWDLFGTTFLLRRLSRGLYATYFLCGADMLTSRFIHQSRKLCNCGGLLKNCTFALAFSRQVSSCIPPNSMADSFRRFPTRFSSALPLQWRKSSGELLEMMTPVRRLSFFKIT